MSAALQDHKRAVVIGERTWGKGSVQNVIKLEEGKSQLKLTTASYHRPSGKNIHRFPDSKETDEWGVMPDDKFVVPFSGPELENYLDYRRHRDVVSKEGPPKSDFQDKQLAKALEYVTEKISGEKKPDSEAKPDADKTTAKADGKPAEKTTEKAPEKDSAKKDAPKDKPGDSKPEAKKSPESKTEASAGEVLRRLREIPRRTAMSAALAG